MQQVSLNPPPKLYPMHIFSKLRLNLQTHHKQRSLSEFAKNRKAHLRYKTQPDQQHSQKNLSLAANNEKSEVIFYKNAPSIFSIKLAEKPSQPQNKLIVEKEKSSTSIKSVQSKESKSLTKYNPISHKKKNIDNVEQCSFQKNQTQQKLRKLKEMSIKRKCRRMKSLYNDKVQEQTHQLKSTIIAYPPRVLDLSKEPKINEIVSVHALWQKTILPLLRTAYLPAGLLLSHLRHYVLAPINDVSEYYLIYQQQQDRNALKSILAMERVIVIAFVQAIIRGKWEAVRSTAAKIAQIICQTYKEVIQDINRVVSISKSNSTLADSANTNDGSNQNFELQKHDRTTRNFRKFTDLEQQMKHKIILLTRHFKQIHSHLKQTLPQFANLPCNLHYYYLLNFYAHHLIGNDWSLFPIQFLQTCPSPYLHHAPAKSMTLLLDLDETLVHFKANSSSQGQFLLRPGLFQFLDQVQPHYEIGIFTCSLQQYADLVISHLPQISFSLYRQHALKVQGELIKDLSRVGRDLKRLLLIDNLDKNFRMQPSNGIHIRSWYGDKSDKVLFQIAKELVKVAKEQCGGLADIRDLPFKRSFL